MNKPTKTPERAAFEKWYATRTFDYGSDPIGSSNRECELRWAAWQGAVADLAERDVEVLQEWKSLLASLASVVRVQNGTLHEDINKLLAHADALLAQPSKAQCDEVEYSQGVCADGAAILRDGVMMTVDDIVATLNAQPAQPSKAQGGNGVIAWMTHHDQPMLFLDRAEAASYCDDDEPPIQLFTQSATPAADPVVPEGYVLVPRYIRINADAWKTAQFAFGGPGTGKDEAFMDCTAWIGDIDNENDGGKTHGMHISCNECPEEGSITLAEFAAAPKGVI